MHKAKGPRRRAGSLAPSQCYQLFGDVNRCDGGRASTSIFRNVLFPFKKGIAERGDVIRSDEPEPVDRFGKRNCIGEAFGLRAEFFELALGEDRVLVDIGARDEKGCHILPHLLLNVGNTPNDLGAVNKSVLVTVVISESTALVLAEAILVCLLVLDEG